MNEKLKPCPFCGDEVEIFETGLYHWNYAIRHKSKEECVLDALAFVLPFEKDKAMRMWNERAEGEVRQVKCGDCKWLTEEKRSSVGYECLQPEKKAAWDEKELSRKMAGRFCYEVVARYKQKSMKACEKFEAKEDE